MYNKNGSPQLLKDLFKNVYKPLKLRGKSDSIVLQYLYAFKRFTIAMGRQPTVNDLNDHVMSEALSKLSIMYSPRTVNNTRAYLLSLWRFANRKGLVRLGPDVERVIEPESIPMAFTTDELKRLFEAAGERSVQWESLLRSIFDTGERIDAVLKWRWDMLDESTGDIFAPAEIRKGRRRSKVYRLREKALSLVLQIPRESEFIFRPYGSDIYKIFDSLAKKAGVPKGKEWKFHAIRKSHASYLKKNGGDATESLGHVSSHTTDKYLSPRVLDDKRQSDFLPEV